MATRDYGRDDSFYLRLRWGGNRAQWAYCEFNGHFLELKSSPNVLYAEAFKINKITSVCEIARVHWPNCEIVAIPADSKQLLSDPHYRKLREWKIL